MQSLLQLWPPVHLIFTFCRHMACCNTFIEKKLIMVCIFISPINGGLLRIFIRMYDDVLMCSYIQMDFLSIVAIRHTGCMAVAFYCLHMILNVFSCELVNVSLLITSSKLKTLGFERWKCSIGINS